MADLLTIGTSGVLTHQTLLQTTSNNISNVNTKGYSRQDNVVYTNQTDQGTGVTTTRRVINEYAERELLRDNASVGYYTAKMDGLSSIDQIMSDKSTGLSSSITDLFGCIQSANTNPTSVANRNELMGSIGNFNNRINNLGSNIQQQYLTANEKICETVDKINQLLKGIHSMNSSILSATGSHENSASYLQMLDERDSLITELSSYIDIKTVQLDSGVVNVNMISGQTLVLGDGCAQLSAEQSVLDNANYSLRLSYGGGYTTLKTSVGGELQGYFDSCEQLKDLQRQLGQMVWALTDKLNVQNNAGMTLVNTVGSDIYGLPEVMVTGTSRTSTMTMSFIEGKGSNVTANDYMIAFGDANTYEVYEVKGDNVTKIKDGVLPAAVGGKHELEFEDLGFKVKLNGTPARYDQFLVQPTMDVAIDLKTVINKPEDLGLASVIRGNQDANNMGNAVFKLNGVTSTIAGSAFDIDATQDTITLKDTAPVNIYINSDGNYEVQDKNGNVIGIALANTNGTNILENLQVSETDATKIYTDVNSFPGYDFSITGTIHKGDKYFVEINTNGSADNSNGILLQNIEQAKIVKDTINKTATEFYSGMVSEVGTVLQVSQINFDASNAKKEQSELLALSSRGVELNEEAANLVKFQQCYAACAKVINAAQTIFDSLISAIR
jgi:flagellar hook-associated protein 1 FlgK